MQLKTCNKSDCLENNPQPIENFYKDSKNPNKFRGACKSCMNRHERIFRKRNPHKSREYRNKNKDKMRTYYKGYNLQKYWPNLSKHDAINEYEKLYKMQNGHCCICLIYKQNLNVDHCHKTNKVRGLLCNNCNRGIGHLKENINNLERAKQYLINNTAP